MSEVIKGFFGFGTENNENITITVNTEGIYMEIYEKTNLSIGLSFEKLRRIDGFIDKNGKYVIEFRCHGSDKITEIWINEQEVCLTYFHKFNNLFKQYILRPSLNTLLADAVNKAINKAIEELSLSPIAGAEFRKLQEDNSKDGRIGP